MQIPTHWIAHASTLRLLALVLSYAVSLLIFQRGLLVKRQVLPNKSGCADVVAVGREHCWIPARFNKSVMLIVDALRYDFIHPFESAHDTHYIGQMTKVAHLLKQHPQNAQLFPFIADAPTTTFQRIKALVTGSVPAFIEAGDNFGGIEITEDNIVDQLVAAGRNVTLMGDETWIQLLPGRFHRHFEEPSFDIKDLDTVDNTVIAHIFTEMARPDWTLLIAHCLGVDHAGHRYGPGHSEMRRKLRQMDQLVWDVVRALPEDAVLFVLGDHGMTQSGDHGGDSRLETMSALFAYTKQCGGFGRSNSFLADEEGKCQLGRNQKQPFNQVDLVPTLALLLDLPIPYASIGQLIDPLFKANGPRELERVIRLNTFQMLRYAQEFARHQPELKDPLRQAVRQHESGPDDFEANQRTIVALITMIRQSLQRQFQWTVCVLGLLSLLDAILFNCYLLVMNTGGEGERTSSGCLWIFRSALLLLQLSLVFAQHPSTDQVLFSLASLALSLGYLLPVSLAKLCKFQWKSTPLLNSFTLVLVAQLFLSVLPFSNSYIIYEADVYRFALQSLVLWVAGRQVHLYRITSLRNIPSDLGNQLSNAFLLLVIPPILRPFESCREEQVDCLTYRHSDSQQFLICVMISLGSAYLLTEQLWPAAPLTKLFVWPMTVLLCFHWLFELTAQSMHGRQHAEGVQSSTSETIVALEFYSRLLALCIYALLILYHFALRCFHSITSKEGMDGPGWLESHFQVLSVPLMMLLGPTHGWTLALVMTVFPMGEQLFAHERIWTWTWFLHLLGAYTFYATGHLATLSAIPWRAAFVGLPGNFPYKWVPGLLILTSMFSGRVLAALMGQRVGGGLGERKAPLLLLLFAALKVFGCAAASLLHHRHLMFYKVFAPKFVFDAVELLFYSAFVVVWNCLLMPAKFSA